MDGKNIVRIAELELGQSEQPPNTNQTKYGKWFGFNGVPWCGIFVSWCYHNGGFPLGNIGFLRGFAGCRTAIVHFTKKGEITDKPEAGDIVFFDWNGDKRYDHVGIFVRWIDQNRFTTIEGNTSLSNNSNGGKVMLRVRQFKNVVFVHPKVLDKKNI